MNLSTLPGKRRRFTDCVIWRIDATQYLHLDEVHAFTLDKVDLASRSAVLDVPAGFGEDDIIAFPDNTSDAQDRTLDG